MAAEKRRKAVARILPATNVALVQPELLSSATDSRPAAEKNNQQTCISGDKHEEEQAKPSGCTAAVDKANSDHSTDISLQSKAVLPKQPGDKADAQPLLGEANADSPAPPVVGSGCSKELQANGDSNCNGVRASDDSASSQAESATSSSANAAPVQSAPQQKQAGDATDRLAAQERQQQVVQYLVDGCDELSESHQQVCRRCAHSVNKCYVPHMFCNASCASCK